MKKIWSLIDRRKWHAATKYKLTSLTMALLFGLAGFALWLVVSIWTLSTPDWMVCFIGYPVVAAWTIVYFYSCNHPFHNGRALS